MKKILPSLIIACCLIFALCSDELNAFARAILQVNLGIVILSSLYGFICFIIAIIKKSKEEKVKFNFKDLVINFKNKIFLFLDFIQNNLFKILVVFLLLLINVQVMSFCKNFKKEIEYVQKQLDDIENEVDGFYGDWFRKYF